MSRVDPATSHRRLQSVRFLSADIDRELYADLKNRVLGLLGSDEKIELPDVNAPHAWSRTFSVYQKLQARLDRETAANEQQANIAGATELRWNEFVSGAARFWIIWRTSMSIMTCASSARCSTPTL